MTVTNTINRIPESDLLAHIEDERLFWVPRFGRNVKLAWNELTATEKQQQREAEAYAAYCVLFKIYEY